MCDRSQAKINKHLGSRARVSNQCEARLDFLRKAGRLGVYSPASTIALVIVTTGLGVAHGSIG